MNIIQKKFSGLWITIILSVFLLFFFFGKSLTHLNTYYFTSEGDGIHAYYTALYHVHHDSTYWRMNGMNYPQGEEVFFTGCQPIVTNVIKLLGLGYFTVGILNFIMLISIVFCSVFLYLIFRRLKVQEWLAISAALFIAFSSPQIGRLNGHFSLTYQFAIPALIYLLMRFWDTPSYKNSIYIGVLTLFMTGVQFYFFGFFALISFFFWIYFFVINYQEKKSILKSFGFSVLHFSIQLILPFLAIKFLVSSIDPVLDRTNEPFGFFMYVTKPVTVFYPLLQWYNFEWLQHFFRPPAKIEWEGLVYLGLTSIVLFVYVLFKQFDALVHFRIKKVLWPFEKTIMNILLYISVVALIVSTALPFMMFDRWLYYEIGYFKQMRGIGRFAWVTFYCLNILSVYWLSQQMIQRKWMIYVSVFFMMVMATEAYDMSGPTGKAIANNVPEMNMNKIHKDFEWVKKVENLNFQAIITLPYFHVGSENIWIDPGPEPMKYAYLSSLHTGKPLVNVLLNRNSLSETYDHIRIIQEPYILPNFVTLKSKSPYLLVVLKNLPLTNYEQEMLNSSRRIDENEKLIIAELPSSYFEERITAKLNFLPKLETQNYFKFDQVFYSDSSELFKMNLFAADPATKNSNVKSDTLIHFPRIYDDVLPMRNDSTEFYISFWISNFTDDVIPRSVAEVAIWNGDQLAKVDYFSLGSQLVTVDGKEGLIEIKFKAFKGQRMTLVPLNEIIHPGTQISWHNVMLRSVEDSIWCKNENGWMLNNRYYPKK